MNLKVIRQSFKKLLEFAEKNGNDEKIKTWANNNKQIIEKAKQCLEQDDNNCHAQLASFNGSLS